MTTIPFKSLKAAVPQPGTLWNFNIGRVHFFTGAKGKTKRERSVWTGILNPSKVPEDGSFGQLIFE